MKCYRNRKKINYLQTFWIREERYCPRKICRTRVQGIEIKPQNKLIKNTRKSFVLVIAGHRPRSPQRDIRGGADDFRERFVIRRDSDDGDFYEAGQTRGVPRHL